MARIRFPTFPLSLIAIGLLVLGLGVPSAQASSCSSRLLSDWRDGRIDATYPIHCYRDALADLPEDLRVYSTVENDITRALEARLAEGPADQQRVVVAPAAKKSAGASATGGHRRPATEGSQMPELLGALGVILLAAGSIGTFLRGHRARRRSTS